VHKRRKRLTRLRFAGEKCAAQCLEPLDCLVTGLEEWRADRALRLRLAVLGGDEPPALLDATLGGGRDMIAIALGQWGHGLRVGLRSRGLCLAPRRWHTGNPLHRGFGALLEVVFTREGTIGDKIGGTISRLSLRQIRLDDRPKLFHITAMATEGLHQDRKASLMLANELQHPLMQVRPMLSAVAAGAVHHRRLGLLLTVIAAVDVTARAIERHNGRGSSQAFRRGGGNEAVECRHPIVIEGVQGTTESLIIELGGDHAGRHEAGGGLMLEEPGDEGERVLDKSQAIEPHGFDRFPDGEVAHFRVLLGRFVNDIAHAKFVKHARDEAEVIEGLTAVGVFHQFSSPEEILPTPRITQIPSRVCGMSALCLVLNRQVSHVCEQAMVEGRVILCQRRQPWHPAAGLADDRASARMVGFNGVGGPPDHY
jgi:hypothetical protein